MITLLYNYYHPENKSRAAEIDACFRANAANEALGRIVVVVEPSVTMLMPESPRIVYASVQGRPAFADFFRIWRQYCDGVCVILNSDCFLDERDTEKLLSIRDRCMAAILRREAYGATWPVTDPFRTLATRRKHEGDMQDAWAFRGAPPPGMSLDFSMGTPGCDNRLAGEFNKAGYAVINPWRDIRLYHLHRNRARQYTEADRVAPPYYFPVPSPRGTLFTPEKKS
jgi:hypothetical protein